MNIEEFFLSVCFVQSIFAAILLLKPSKNRLSNVLLALWLLTWGGMCYFRFMIFQDVHYILKYHYLLKLNNTLYLMFFVYPFLYVKYISKDLSHFKKRDLLHFSPALLATITLVPFFILSGEEKVKILLSSVPYYKTLAVIFDYTVIAQGLIYVYFSLRYIRNYHHRIKENYSNIEHLTIYWLRNIIIIISSIWILGTLESYFFDSYYMGIYYVNFMFMIIGLSIFYISYNMYAKKELFSFSHTTEIRSMFQPVDMSHNDNNCDIKEKKGDYLSDAYCDEAVSKLLSVMEINKLYLDQNLSLEDVSSAIFISRHHLSAILNNHLNISFFDFVNKYRIQEVKRRMHDTQYEKLTLLAIAFDAGFNSKATFNRSFKKHEGVTPLEYRNSSKL